MNERLISYSAFVARIAEKRAPGTTLLIGIDGPGGSGKSTLARQLAAYLCALPTASSSAPPAASRAPSEAVALVHVDDFYQPAARRFSGPPSQRPIAADYDRERLAREVLAPLRAGRTASYRRYDWASDALAVEPTRVSGPIVLVEGVYAISAPLYAFYDVTLWVECPRQRRLERGLARDGEAARQRWVDDWMPGEDAYVAREAPQRRASFVCDGAHDAHDIRLLAGEL